MSKAEDRAWEWASKNKLDPYSMGQAYAEGYHQAEKDLTDKSRVSSGWDGFFYGQGYKQAEEDLELTWEDVKLIWNITDEMDNMPEEEFYQEVLKRFKERKEK